MPVERSARAWPLAILLAVVFFWGIWQVALTPLKSGDVYPPYSTLRSDPQGAKVLFESLSQQPEIDVARLYKSRTPMKENEALFVMGVNSAQFVTADARVLDAYASLLREGGRVVISFLPTHAPRSEGTPGAIEAKWNLGLRFREESTEERDSGAIPKSSALYFEPGPEWHVLREQDDLTVAAERTLGKGVLVLVAQSYPLSNQGMAEASDADLVVKLAGNSRRISFDENQFGVTESGSVTVLLRKYRLENAMAVLFVVAGLFLWRGSSSFLPVKERAVVEPSSGRDSHDGLATLLSRSVPAKDLLKACFAEWNQPGMNHPRADDVRAELEGSPARDIVAAYRAASRALMEKK